MADRIELTVGPEDRGVRIDVLVADHVPEMSRSAARSLIDRGHVRVNGASTKPSRHVLEGEVVSIQLEPRPRLQVVPEEMPLTVVYQDEDMAVIDKPAGLVVHPAAGHMSGTLANALAARFPSTRGAGSEERPGLVHRLDKDTSGLMVVALSPRGYASLHTQIANRTAGRTYLALVTGQLDLERADIDAPIGRDSRDRRRMVVHGAAAREARTSYQVVERLPRFSLLECRLHTGRTHQIRVHLAAIGHPIAGDSVYGGPTIPGLHRQFLHACKLDLRSPSSGEPMTFASDLPNELREVLEALRTGTTSIR